MKVLKKNIYVDFTNLFIYFSIFRKASNLIQHYGLFSFTFYHNNKYFKSSKKYELFLYGMTKYLHTNISAWDFYKLNETMSALQNIVVQISIF